MKISEAWLREWVNPPVTRKQLCEQLTMLGLEVESSEPVMDISITPNRGDCLSINGLAREVAAFYQVEICAPKITLISPLNQEKLVVNIKTASACPRYVGRVIRQVKNDAITPTWMQERLNSSDINCISPIVDVMNYVMLELGQPMHAFDLACISGDITVRFANQKESITLLDGQTIELNPNTLVIADRKQALAIAGVMGGLDSAVTLNTQDIFLESAFFTASGIAKTCRTYGMTSDSSYRFERGIDPTIQVQAIERATELLLEIVGGQPGPIVECISQEELPKEITIHLRAARIATFLGVQIAKDVVQGILQWLGMSCQQVNDGWQVTVPPRRSDITLEEDLIEEVIRSYGYEKLPTHNMAIKLTIPSHVENKLSLATMRKTMCDLGFHEVITYSFIDKKLQAMFDPELSPKELMNPMTADMAVMRTSLLPGLITTLAYNQHRQQLRGRLFEIGLRFIENNNQLLQQQVISGLISESAYPAQWGIPNRKADFFDLKGCLQNLLQLTHDIDNFTFKPEPHPALHSGQTAAIYRQNKKLGYMGVLHPQLLKSFDLEGPVCVFELDLDVLRQKRQPRFKAISKFPEIRRDIAILIDRTIPSAAIQDTIKKVAGELLQEVNIFDVYQGKGIATERKSIALSLILQHASRTLIEEEVAELMERVIAQLKKTFSAELRS